MNESKNNPIIMLFETVAYLHQKGYEKIRLMTSIAPSGCYFRICISTKKHFDNKTGFVLCKCEDNEVYRYSTGGEFRFFKDEPSYEEASIEEIANRLLTLYPIIENEGKGKDKEYVRWFHKLLDMVKDYKYPYAIADYGYDIFKEGKILFTNEEDSIEYAPPGDHDYKERW